MLAWPVNMVPGRLPCAKPLLLRALKTIVAVVCRMFSSKPKASHSQTFSLTFPELRRSPSERACKTRAASIVHTGPKLAFPFASSLLVAALLHAVKVFVPVLSGEVFPPAIYAKEAIRTAGHIEAHLIYGCLFVGVCPGAAFQRHQR